MFSGTFGENTEHQPQLEGFGKVGKVGELGRVGEPGEVGKVGELGEVGKPGRVAANWICICKLVLKAANGLDWAMLMVTDVLRGNSVLLCSASKYEKKLSYRAIANQTYDMPQVLSRKKQLLPEILHTID